MLFRIHLSPADGTAVGLVLISWSCLPTCTYFPFTISLQVLRVVGETGRCHDSVSVGCYGVGYPGRGRIYSLLSVTLFVFASKVLSRSLYSMILAAIELLVDIKYYRTEPFLHSNTWSFLAQTELFFNFYKDWTIWWCVCKYFKLNLTLLALQVNTEILFMITFVLV